jgi:hypothetical protein
MIKNTMEFMTTKPVLRRYLKESYSWKRKLNATRKLQERISPTR